ncbi:7fd08379-6e30-44cf-8182-4450efede129-CDS [Sclerotinia trifoliorum]|uniref:7fd08379-6e30-44cf-8182-4450efede129-CDS n=1 Tax=Sclerotinia trifoliorum TaxID=28548 RepID=A0A8H2ZUR3_9HELO|nr:7fd08379-6e30-44cf-8182-4450efede129-CDS [Sclerotinia trifoliorum]
MTTAETVTIFLASFGGFFTAIAAFFCAPFFFDRMGWRFPLAPSLPPPPRQPRHIHHIHLPGPAHDPPFAEGSTELRELQRIRVETRMIRICSEVIGMMAIRNNANSEAEARQYCDKFERLTTDDPIDDK